MFLGKNCCCGCLCIGTPPDQYVLTIPGAGMDADCTNGISGSYTLDYAGDSPAVCTWTKTGTLDDPCTGSVDSVDYTAQLTYILRFGTTYVLQGSIAWGSNTLAFEKSYGGTNQNCEDFDGETLDTESLLSSHCCILDPSYAMTVAAP